jgi:O-antigen/teichoic acid export membrane protein
MNAANSAPGASFRCASGVVNWSASSVLTVSPKKAKALHSRIVSGSMVLITGYGLTTAINLGYNVIFASILGPAGFGHATVVYTVLTILSALALTVQIVSAKLIAQQALPEAKVHCYRVFHRAAWGSGLLGAVVLFVFQRQIANYLNLPDPGLIAWMAVAFAFFVPLGGRRGWTQGTCGFRSLALSMMLEAGARLVGSYFLFELGFGLRGIVAGYAIGIAAAYLALRPNLKVSLLVTSSANPVQLSATAHEMRQALAFYAGQMLISNFDIVLVKHLFPAELAGIFAAVALVGRVIWVLSAAVVNTMVPLVAGTGEKERKDFRVIATSLVLVIAVNGFLVMGLWLTPAWIWTKYLGSGFAVTGAHSISYLATIYGLKSIIYSIAAVFITFEMSYKIGHSSAVQLLFSVVMIAGVYEFHSSLLEVILVQMVLLAILAIVCAVPLLTELHWGASEHSEAQQLHAVRLLRKVSEDEVVAEFLKSDYSILGYQQCPKVLREMIIRPDFTDDGENAKRRALFLLRHYSLWKVIPDDVVWYEAELNEPVLEQVRVFPRAQWRKLARGNFAVTNAVEALRSSPQRVDAKFVEKIMAIGAQLRQGSKEFGAVLLLGLSEETPVTVLDGNHRLVAAMLSSPTELSKLRFMCGLSPRMAECCWYKTNVATLVRYARHLLAAAIHDPRADFLRTLGALHDHGHPRAARGAGDGAVTGLVVEADDVRT